MVDRDIFYFAAYCSFRAMIGEVIVYDCAASLLFLNNFASPQSRKQGGSLRGTAPDGDYKSIKPFKVSDKNL